MPQPSKKQQTQEEIFSRCCGGKVQEGSGGDSAQFTSDLVFDNELVKSVCRKTGFQNPFDVFHIDNTEKLPPVLRNNDYFVVHLGKGRHKFVKGVKYGYHVFEDIQNVIERNYRASILNELNTSESNILSVAYNQRIMHDFLYSEVAATPKIYNSHRTNLTATYYIGGERVSLNNQQIEIDMTAEENGIVTVFEAKNGFPKDFAVSQIYLPFLYYTKHKKEGLAISDLNACYLLRRQTSTGSIIRLYKYTFTEPYDMSSLSLIKNAEYRIVRN